jgi:hypothetical protein
MRRHANETTEGQHIGIDTAKHFTPSPMRHPTPPNAPPMSEAALRSRKWRNWIWGVGIFSMVVVCGGIVSIFVAGEIRARNHSRYGNLTQAHSNLRQIGFALSEFEVEYGKLPETSTIALMPSGGINCAVTPGRTSSNELFRQLFAANIVSSESMFHARTPSNHRRPDNDFSDGNALLKGECSFAYVAGVSNPDTPVVVFPLVPGKLIFDYKLCQDYYAGFALILFANISVQRLPVDKHGHVYLNGKDLFDPSQSFWGGKIPDVKWPE